MATLRQVFSDIAGAIRAKGVSGTFKPIDMASKIGEIQTGGGSEPTNARACFAGDVAVRSLVVPRMMVVDMTAIDNLKYFFYSNNMTSLTLPEGFGKSTPTLQDCFNGCSHLSSLTLPAGFGQNATNVVACFFDDINLSSIELPAGFGQSATNTTYCFDACYSLKTITGNPNFKVSVDFTSCKNLTHDSIMVVINGLQTVTETQTLTLGSTNLDKLTQEEKQVAIDKGWTLA